MASRRVEPGSGGEWLLLSFGFRLVPWDCFVAPRSSAEDWQPRLWAIVIGLGLIVIWVIAFIAKNSDHVQIDFVLFSTSASLIWLLILLLGVGFLGGVLASQLYRRRSGRAAQEHRGADG